MALDIEKWLTEDLGFSADEAKTLAPSFSTRADKVEKGILRQADYSRQMNEFNTKTKADQDRLAAAESKLNGEMAEWASLTAAEKREAGDLKAKLDASEAKVFGMQQKLTRLAEDAGIDPKTVLDGDVVVEPKKPEVVAFDPSGLQQQIGGVAEYMMTLSAELPAIAQEHFELTGERLDTRAFVNGIKADIKANAKNAVMDPVARWEKEFGIPDRRKQAAEKAIDNRIAVARAEERTAVLSEQALPNTAVRPGTHSPVFKTAQVAKGSVLQRPQPSQKLAGAVSALATGRYRSDQKTA